MKSPYGLPCIESCLSCKLRTDDFFCALSQESLEAFNQIKHGAVFPAKPFRNTPRQLRQSRVPGPWAHAGCTERRAECPVYFQTRALLISHQTGIVIDFFSKS